VQYYFYILLSIILASCGTKPIKVAAQPEETEKSVTNYLTEQYKDIPGTKLSFLPPKSFTYDPRIGGWSSTSKGSWIISSSVQGKPLLAAGLYKARLSDISRPDAIEGSLLQEWDISLNARQSKLFKIETSLGGDDHLQYVLFTGDTTGYRVIGSVHGDELEFVPQVKKAVLSIFFDPERIINGQNPTQTSASPCNCPK
jgi:hypothetical protein